jgi:hypothetical protein
MLSAVLTSPDFSPYTTDQLSAFHIYLRQYSIQKGLEQRYDDAQRAHFLSDAVLSEINRRAPIAPSGPDLVNLADQERIEFESKWNRQIQDCDEKCQARRAQLDERQADERRRFEVMWMEEMPRKYRKPSPQLLQLRKIEKSLAVSGDFEQAKKIHADAEALARIEMENAQSMLIRDYEIAHHKMMQKQQQENELFEATRKEEKAVLLAQYDSEKVAIEHRDLVVQVRTQNVKKVKNERGVGKRPIAFQAHSRTGAENVLLPPLKPPNDPMMLEEQNRRKKDEERRKLAMQKKHAEDVLLKYSVDAQGIADRRAGGRTVKVREANGLKVVDHLQDEEVQPERKAEGEGWREETEKVEPQLDRIRHSFVDAQSH